MGLLPVVWLQVKIQNSVTNQLHCIMVFYTVHIDIFDCNRVLFRISFDAVTSEILVNALSDRYTHWSSVHNKKRYLYETETYGNRN